MSVNKRKRSGDSAATRLGRGVAGLRRNLRRSQPQAEKAARAAVEAARPAAERALRFVQEHEDEIKQVGAAGARIVVNRATPPALRPVVSAVERELSRDAGTPEQDQPGRPEPKPEPDDLA